VIGSRLATATAGCLVALGIALATDARAATVQAFPVTNGGPHAIVALRSGTEVAVGARNCAYIGRLAVVTGVFAPSVPAPGALGCSSDDGVFSMVEAPDGKLYFTVYDPPPADGKGAVGRVNPDGSGLETAVVNDGHPLDLTVGSDGNVWFTINGPPGKVGRITPASPLAFQTGTVPGGVQGPRGIVAAPDGNLYVLGGESGKIWRVTTGPAPAITEVATGQNGPSFGEVGPDGRVWFTRFEGDSVAALDPATGAVSSDVPVTGSPWDVAFGGDGKAYVSRFSAASVVQFTPGSPILTPLAMPAASDNPVFASRAPSGHVFVAAVGSNSVLDITPDAPPPPPPPPPPPAAAPPPPPAVAPLVSGRVTATWRVLRTRTRVLSLAARGLARGVTVEVRCSGGGCPFTRKRLKPKTGATSISLTRLFKSRTLRAGRTIEVRITKSANRGRVVRFKTRSTAKPARATLCLPVGSTRPGRC
jgi:streptogramin lyase